MGQIHFRTNMKSAIIATIIGSAAAFAPAPVAKTTTSLNAFEDELGAQPPLGFFDPFGMLSGDVTQERFDRLRYVEIKHGRICQLAFLGQVVTRGGLHLPGDIDYSGDSFDSSPTVLLPSSDRTPSPLPDLSRSSPSLGGWSAPSCAMSLELATCTLATSAMDTLTSAGMTLMRRPSSPSVPLSLTTAVPL